MKHLSALFTFALVALLAAYLLTPSGSERPKTRDIVEIRDRVSPLLDYALAAKGLALGAPAYIRIFKEERLLEVWVQRNREFTLFQSYDICNHSGGLGPKLKEGDRQSPEGFYHVDKAALNPNSRYHLSFNLGFPNAYDRSHDRTGSFLMVHGACASVGCYAMTDPVIEEIYVLVEAALNGGQKSVPVHAFPFRMTETRLAEAANSPWYVFWQDLKQGHDAFEATGVPPEVVTSDGRYRVATR